MYFINMITCPAYKRFMIGSTTYGYSGNVYQTDGGTLIRFMVDEVPAGPFPGVSWDTYVDNMLPRLRPHTEEGHIFPSITIPVNQDRCLRCSTESEYQFCSEGCWREEMLRVLRNSPELHNKFLREFPSEPIGLFQCL